MNSSPTLYFSPRYTREAFLGCRERRGHVAFNLKAVNIDGLVAELALRSGVVLPWATGPERQTAYFKAMQEAIATGECREVFSRSFEVNPLGVSNECLRWRDALRLAGWDSDQPQPSARLKALAEVERHFSVAGPEEGLRKLIGLLESGEATLPKGLKIVVGYPSAEYLHPAVNRLLETCRQQGAIVEWTPRRAWGPEGSFLRTVQEHFASPENTYGSPEDELLPDGSLEVWEFASPQEAVRYLSLLPREAFTVTALSDAKGLDNTLAQLGLPTVGSSIDQAQGQTVQMFTLGMSLWDFPTNIARLLDWLQTPVSPLANPLRSDLAKAVASTGGIKNEAWKKAVEAYKERLEEEGDTKKAKNVEARINKFIPQPKGANLSVEAVEDFCRALGSWAAQRTQFPETPLALVSQLGRLSSLCDMMEQLLRATNASTIPYTRLQAMVQSLDKASSLPLYPHSLGAPKVVSSPADIVAPAERTLWADCYNFTASPIETDFLNDPERQALQAQGCEFQNPDLANRALLEDENTLFLLTRHKAVAVTVAGQQLHPFIIRLRQMFPNELAWKEFVKHPETDPSRLQVRPSLPIEHSDGDFLHIRQPQRLADRFARISRWSFSSLDLLFQDPFNFVADKLLYIGGGLRSQLKEVFTVKGDVAHAVIARLVSGSPQKIKDNIASRFEETFNSVVNEQGAILLMEENALECGNFKNDLKENLEVLQEIIERNGLRVIGNELLLSDQRLPLPDGQGDLEMTGFIDMVLEHEADGSLVVFDFKWSPSKKYEKLLRENRALQLALYAYLAHKQLGKEPSATAYFRMPSHHLYTTASWLHGSDVVNVEEAEQPTMSLVKKAANSFLFRRGELGKGEVEFVYDDRLEELPYHEREQESHDLVPLALSDDCKKEGNNYSVYKFFTKPTRL